MSSRDGVVFERMRHQEGGRGLLNAEQKESVGPYWIALLELRLGSIMSEYQRF